MKRKIKKMYSITLALPGRGKVRTHNRRQQVVVVAHDIHEAIDVAEAQIARSSAVFVQEQTGVIIAQD